VVDLEVHSLRDQAVAEHVQLFGRVGAAVVLLVFGVEVEGQLHLLVQEDVRGGEGLSLVVQQVLSRVQDARVILDLVEE